MRFDLDHSRFDSCRFVEGRQLVQGDVRQSDGPASAMVDKTLHCLPGIEQSYPAVVKDIALLIARILIVSWLKRKRSVDEVEIQIVEPESVETRLECRFDELGPMIGVPQLRGDKNVFARDPPAASPACNASPTSRSFRYRSAQSKCRNPPSSASLVAVIVTPASGMRVPKPTAGRWPLWLLSGVLFIRSSEDSVIAIRRQCFAFCVSPRFDS
jgi:hypothetical protein